MTVSGVVDFSELDKYSKQLYNYGANFKRKQKKFLEKEGNYLRSNILSEAKRHGKRASKLYRRSMERGKFYRRDKTAAIRVYGGAPHLHLVEEGHRMVTHDGKEVGFIKGTHAMEIASKKFEPFFLREVEAMILEDL